MSKVATMCCLFDSFLFPAKGGPDFNLDPAKLHPLICTAFLFIFLWSIGANLIESCNDMFDTFTRDLFADNHDVRVSKITLVFVVLTCVSIQSMRKCMLLGTINHFRDARDAQGAVVKERHFLASSIMSLSFISAPAVFLEAFAHLSMVCCKHFKGV